ncbi:uncharacterized protein [Panulirus ornatus]|uniref:uncharacterized protein n=1 Tax=Panulirus ornatus TaxID=150431 RepID=UPI003A871665
MHQYKNAPWSETGPQTTTDSSPPLFRTGIETSSKLNPLETFEEWQIPVRLREDVEGRLGMKGEAVLLVKTDSIFLQGGDLKTWSWSINAIRRYGYNTTSFHLEAGRKSKTGDGVFTFLTDKGYRIYQKVNEMKEYLQFELLCRKGKSPEDIILLVSNDEPEQPSFRRGLGYSLKIRRSMIRHSSQESSRSTRRSNSQPDLNTTSQFPGTHMESKANIKALQGTQTLPRRREMQGDTMRYVKDGDLPLRSKQYRDPAARASTS